ncbi:FG-GAP-like repeat-containing protein [Streptomyces sp. NBC_00576]|uniref:FG-GAP-like repeat-containing protein n=1 Tax=Streptomyces sp. NBC_00576 TaxID=2903665 RepID=UPI002E816394|nr:FG-GAP-like repeat-containing protein [Streptomyces sp. NBC_00576]WUB69391.1 trypsin-like serine protease [Streptomyces sp. NBC_00576]
MYLARRPRLSALAAALLAAPVMLSAAPATALTGADAPAQLNYVAKINVGEQSACSGTLIAPQWVLTAATCFAADGKPPAGKPAITTTVTVGRTDLTQTSGSVLSAIRLVPHADRDLVLVKLAARITDPSITPVRLATTPAAAGEELVKAGFGRTKTEWVPDKLHTGTFTVASTTDTTVDLNGSDTATVCKGDAGGPALRTVNGTTELVAINSRSWQGGCLGNDPAETRTGAIDTRVDDISGWVDHATSRNPDDLTGDGKADLAAIKDDGVLWIYPGTGNASGSTLGTRFQAGVGWQSQNAVTTGDLNNDGIGDLLSRQASDGTLWVYPGTGKPGMETFGTRYQVGRSWQTQDVTRTGDFNSDGLADVLTRQASDGTLWVYPGTGKAGIDTLGTRYQVGTGWKSQDAITTGDLNNDGRTDVLSRQASDGTLWVYPGTGKPGMGTFGTRYQVGRSWQTQDVTRTGDFNSDGRTDVLTRQASDGTLWVYPGTGKAGIDTLGTRYQAGTGWGPYRII